MTQTLAPTGVDRADRAALVAAANGRLTSARPLAGGVRVLTSPRPIPAAEAEPAATTEPDGIEKVLAAAEASSRQRTRTLGARVRQLIRDLEAALASEAAERKAETRIAQLRAELAEAEQQLRNVRRSGPASTSTPGAAAGDSDQAAANRAVNRAVREWAAANGIACSQRGNVPRDVLAQWQAATGRATS
jgi:hypothetical protein